MRTKVFDRIKALFNWIKNHKYIFVTIVFLAIIIVVDDNNMISHIKNKATIDKLTDEIREMEADSAEVQDKLKLYTDGDLSVIEDVARAQGLIKKDEDIYIIKE
ncbi:MAG: septum formation initiator family protein [Bacteroidaceae bacterium]|nr:septum formation initiator family protein [Bacteroidaceae bacterium]